MPPSFLDELRARTRVSAVVGQDVKLIKAGKEFKACCPFHSEKTPSFYVNDEKGFYHCFGCSAHGDAIGYLIDARGMAFMDAVKELAAKAGMEVPAPDPQAKERAERRASLIDVTEAAGDWFREQLYGIDGGAARQYCQNRGLKSDTLKKFGIGYAPDARGKLKKALDRFGVPKLIESGMLTAPEEREPYDRFRGRLMIPIRDPRGRTIAFGGRIIGDGEPKYLNSPDTPLFDKGRQLYNLDLAQQAARKADRIIVVEGYMDVIALDAAGISEAVAPLGTAVTEAQLQLLWRLSEAPILCFDGDAAGQKAAMRAAERAFPFLGPTRSLSIVSLPDGKDPDDIVREGGNEAFNKLLESAEPLSQYVFRREAQAANLENPEGRAAFSRSLRDLAKTIQDDDVRTQYLGLFRGLISDMFANLRDGGAFKPNDAKFAYRSVSPEMKAIAHLGITQAVEVRVILLGLINYPNVIAEFAEQVAYIWMKERKYALLREAMLTAALSQPFLTKASLRKAIRDEGLGDPSETFRKPFEIRYSFLHGETETNRGRSDLIDMIEVLTAGANIEDEIRQAQERYANAEGQASVEAYDDLQRLIAIQAENEQRFNDRRAESKEAEDTD